MQDPREDFIIQKVTNMLTSDKEKELDSQSLDIPYQNKEKNIFFISSPSAKRKNLKQKNLKFFCGNKINENHPKKFQNGVLMRYLKDSIKMESDDFSKPNDHFNLKKKIEKKLSDRQINTETKISLKNGFEDQKMYQFSELVNIFPEICQKIKECLKTQKHQSMSCSIKQSEKMIHEYEGFRFKNLNFLQNLTKKLEYSGNYKTLLQFVLKFLFDLQKKDDITRLSSKEIYFLEYFLVNRYFKILKNRIIKKIQNEKDFKGFVNLCKSKMNESSPIQSESICISTICYEQSIIKWFDHENIKKVDLLLFDTNLADSLKETLNEGDSAKILKSFIFLLNQIVQILIIKFLVFRFQNSRLIFDEVECIEDDITEIICMILKVFSILKRRFIAQPNDPENKTFIESVCAQIQKLFIYETNKSILEFTRYIKFREMREYVGSKKKSKFTRFRRNDEKIKKVYKHIMMKIYLDYKEQEMQSSAMIPSDFQKHVSREAANAKPERVSLGKRLFKFKDKLQISKVLLFIS